MGNRMYNFKGKRVLIADGATKQALPLIKGFHKLGCIVTVICGSKFDAGYVYKYSDHKILLRIDRHDEETTYRRILKVVKTGNFDLLLPVVDFYAIMFAKHKKQLSESTIVYTENWPVFRQASDKLLTMKACMENNVPCPKTALVDRAEEFEDNGWKYPLVVKPRSGYGAKGFHVVANHSELLNAFEKVTDSFGPALIQEYIPQTGTQYQVELIIDKNHDCNMFVMMEKKRQFPVDGGSSTFNMTMHNETVKKDVLRLMSVIGWRGYASLDLIRDPRDGKVKVFEINPRINSTVKICYACGIDVGKLILEDVFSESMENCMDYPDGVCLRFFHKDILWFIKSKDRWKSKLSFFNFKHNYDMVFEWDDIRPGIVFSINNFKSLFTYKDHE